MKQNTKFEGKNKCLVKQNKQLEKQNTNLENNNLELEKQNTELAKRKILRQNNEESNAITRECIEAALIQLMEVKSFSEISITDITKRAGVSRNAYYRNYSSKEDILTKYMHNILSQISDILKKNNPLTETRESWRDLLYATKSFSTQFKLLIDAGYDSKLRDEIQKSMNDGISKDNYALYYSNCYWSGALFSIMCEWIKNDMDTPIEQLAEVGANLMVNGINTITTYGNSCK